MDIVIPGPGAADLENFFEILEALAIRIRKGYVRLSGILAYVSVRPRRSKYINHRILCASPGEIVQVGNNIQVAADSTIKRREFCPFHMPFDQEVVVNVYAPY